jgi:hypothetical protein
MTWFVALPGYALVLWGLDRLCGDLFSSCLVSSLVYALTATKVKPWLTLRLDLAVVRLADHISPSKIGAAAIRIFSVSQSRDLDLESG